MDSPEPQSSDDSMRDEYDFRTMRGAVRGKYAQQHEAEESKVRIIKEDGSTEEGSVSEMERKHGQQGSQNVTIMAIPNELVPQVQELIAHARK